MRIRERGAPGTPAKAFSPRDVHCATIGYKQSRAVRSRVDFQPSRHEGGDSYKMTISSMAEAMGVQVSSLRHLVEQHPNIVSSLPTRQAEAKLQKVISRMRHLSQSLSIPMELVIKMVTKQPGVLSAPPSMIQERAVDIERRLSIPPGSVLTLLFHQPEFLEMSSERLVSRTLQLGSTLEASPLDILKCLSRVDPPSSLLSLMSKRNSSISLRIKQMDLILQAPGVTGPVHMPDDPTLNEDGSIRFTPMLMRNPLPGAIESLSIPLKEMQVVRKKLRRAAHAIESGSKAAGRLLPPPSLDSSGRRRSRLSYPVAMALKCPDLFLIPMEEIATSHQVLLNLLNVSHTRLSSLLVRCPALLALPAHQIRASWSCLNEELISKAQDPQHSRARKAASSALISKRVQQQPQILALSSKEIVSKMKLISEGLGWSSESTRRAVWNQCQLLGMNVETLRSKVRWLAQAIRDEDSVEMTPLDYELSSELVQRQPGLLTLSIPTLSRNLQGLRTVLQPPLIHPTSLSSSIRSVIETEPTLLTQPPRTLEKKMERLGQILGLPSPLSLVLKYPALFSIPTANLTFKIQEIQMIHNCSRREATALLIESPSLLRSSETNHKSIQHHSCIT